MEDWKEELRKKLQAKWDEEEAQWRKANPGKIRFYLELAPDEPQTFTIEGQAALGEIVSELKANGIELTAPRMTLDSVEAVGGYVGEIAVFIKDVTPVVIGLIAAWAKVKGRKVRIKDGDLEVDGSSAEEVKDLYDFVEKKRLERHKGKDQ